MNLGAGLLVWDAPWAFALLALLPWRYWPCWLVVPVTVPVTVLPITAQIAKTVVKTA